MAVYLLTEYEKYTQWARDGDILFWVDGVHRVNRTNSPVQDLINEKHEMTKISGLRSKNI